MPYAQLNSKWMIDLNRKCQTRKLLGGDLCDMGLGGLDLVPCGSYIKEKWIN